ncbi:MFS transporter, partial [Klebsiella pneumoniae]
MKTATYHFLRHLLFSMNRLNRSCFLIKKYCRKGAGKSSRLPAEYPR